MAGITILPQEQTLGGSLGTGLGSGLSKGLQQLAQAKLQQMTQQQQGQQQQKLYEEANIPTPIARLLAFSPPEFQKQLLDRLEGLELGGQSQQQVMQGAQPGAQPIQSEQPTQSGYKLGPSSQRKMHLENLAIKKEGLEQKSAQYAREWSKPYIERAEASRKNIRDYKLLKALAEKGDIQSGNSHALRTKLGLEDFGKTLTTEIAAKTMARLGQNAASAFGAGTKLTNFLESTFQKSLPTLWNTPQGIVALSDIGILTDQANEIIDDIRRDVLREYKGKLPPDADDIVRERAKPQLDKLEDQIIESALKAIGQSSGNVPGINQQSQFFDEESSIPEGTKVFDEQTGKTLIKTKGKLVPIPGI